MKFYIYKNYELIDEINGKEKAIRLMYKHCINDMYIKHSNFEFNIEDLLDKIIDNIDNENEIRFILSEHFNENHINDRSIPVSWSTMCTYNDHEIHIPFFSIYKIKHYIS